MERKLHLVNWDTVFLSKEKGGLGIRNLSKFNRALLGRWSWRVVMEDNSMWRNVINSKYVTEEGGWFPIIPRNNYG